MRSLTRFNIHASIPIYSCETEWSGENSSHRNAQLTRGSAGLRRIE